MNKKCKKHGKQISHNTTQPTTDINPLKKKLSQHHTEQVNIHNYKFTNIVLYPITHEFITFKLIPNCFSLKRNLSRHQLTRVIFVRELEIHYLISEDGNFSDESRLNIFCSSGMTFVCLKPNTELQKLSNKLIVKHGGGSVVV